MQLITDACFNMIILLFLGRYGILSLNIFLVARLAFGPLDELFAFNGVVLAVAPKEGREG